MTQSVIAAPFCVREMAERGLASRTSDPLSAVPQVARDAAAGCNRSLPPLCGEEGWTVSPSD